MLEISNRQLAGCDLSCFNPALVVYQGKRLLFYRYTPHPDATYTQIAFVELDCNFQPISQHCPVRLPKLTDRVITFDDPRAFVWQEQLWLMHVQAAYTPQKTWSTAIVLARVDLSGTVSQIHVPAYGRNINYAVAEAPPAFEKNWTPVVVADQLYVVYEINPLTVIKFQPKHQNWIPIAHQSWSNPYPTYLSGSTPLIPWQQAEYIGLFHTYAKLPDQQNRLYSMGFYAVDVNVWRVTRISAEPVLVARQHLLGSASTNSVKDSHLVVFPGGISDCGEAWAVSFGWNDRRSYIETYTKTAIAESLVLLNDRPVT